MVVPPDSHVLRMALPACAGEDATLAWVMDKPNATILGVASLLAPMGKPLGTVVGKGRHVFGPVTLNVLLDRVVGA